MFIFYEMLKKKKSKIIILCNQKYENKIFTSNMLESEMSLKCTQTIFKVFVIYLLITNLLNII